MSVLQLLNGLTFAALLFVVASGFTLIFGLMRIVNLAHGAIYLFGGYIGFTVAVRTGSFFLGGLGAMLAAAAIGFRALRGAVAVRARRRIAAGAAHARRGLCARRHGAGNVRWRQYYRADLGHIPRRRPRIGHLLSELSSVRSSRRMPDIFSPLASHTPHPHRCFDSGGRRRRRNGRGLGHQYQANLSLRRSARRPRRTAGGAYLSLYPSADAEILVFSLAVVIIGGRGSLIGVAAGSLLVGLLNTFGQVMFPELAYFVIFGPMAVLLAFRPLGLFGRAT